MIELNDVTFGYSKQNKLFNKLRLNLENSGICGLLGKNGSGKTTLLKIIAGLIFSDEGNVRVFNHKPKNRTPTFLKEIYFLPEDFFTPALSVEQYQNFYASFYPNFDHTFFNNALVEFDLPHHKLLTQFSYGQKKKFLIAFGLATNCSILILDEPTNGLDIPSKTQFRKLLASTISDKKLFLISTHQVHDIEKLIDTVVILNEGKIIYHQPLIEENIRIDLEVLFNDVLARDLNQNVTQGATHGHK